MCEHQSVSPATELDNLALKEACLLPNPNPERVKDEEPVLGVFVRVVLRIVEPSYDIALVNDPTRRPPVTTRARLPPAPPAANTQTS